MTSLPLPSLDLLAHSVIDCCYGVDVDTSTCIYACMYVCLCLQLNQFFLSFFLSYYLVCLHSLAFAYLAGWLAGWLADCNRATRSQYNYPVVCWQFLVMYGRKSYQAIYVVVSLCLCWTLVQPPSNIRWFSSLKSECSHRLTDYLF